MSSTRKALRRSSATKSLGVDAAVVDVAVVAAVAAAVAGAAGAAAVAAAAAAAAAAGNGAVAASAERHPRWNDDTSFWPARFASGRLFIFFACSRFCLIYREWIRDA